MFSSDLNCYQTENASQGTISVSPHWFKMFFVTGSRYVAQGGLELTMLPRLSFVSQFSCLYIQNPGIAGVYDHIEPQRHFQ